MYVSGCKKSSKRQNEKTDKDKCYWNQQQHQAKRALFIVVDGLRVGAIRREIEEGLIPCVILNGMGQAVRVNIGRPRRGQGLLLKREDTIQGEWLSYVPKSQPELDATMVHLDYLITRDQWVTRVKSDEAGSKGFKEEIIYEGWNAAYQVQTAEKQLATLQKFKAFSKAYQVDSRRTRTWCINVRLTHMFLEKVQVRRSKHVADQKAWMSFYTDATGFNRRKVAKDWYNVSATEEEDADEDGPRQVCAEIDEKFLHGATLLFVCFNVEDPQNLSPEYDRKISLKLKLTNYLPVLGPKNQLTKVFAHFTAVTEQGDGHLIHYKEVESIGLKVLQFLKSSERVRVTLLHDAQATEEIESFTIFHAAVAFLKAFCDFESHYRDLFVKKEVFQFLVECISLAEGVPVSDLLVSVFANNNMRINLQFVDELVKAIDENFTKNQQSSLNAMLVLKSMVTTIAESIETRDNGNIIMLRFMAQNTAKRSENPYMPMAFEAFLDAAEFLSSDNLGIQEYLRNVAAEEKEDLRRRETGLNVSFSVSQRSREKIKRTRSGTSRGSGSSRQSSDEDRSRCERCFLLLLLLSLSLSFLLLTALFLGLRIYLQHYLFSLCAFLLMLACCCLLSCFVLCNVTVVADVCHR
ncbi:unnamed protein product [Polarella glacialis]|uniref:Uncharacterized protein n=1 Tax=Polarella glacialis TaxID=89957 RepID=A0A813GPV7_POLGL|nr:unnamed protein product [Polarella glacialis]CAE8645256.1 unnamed protein product [Polarella glacialis]